MLRIDLTPVEADVAAVAGLLIAAAREARRNRAELRRLATLDCRSVTGHVFASHCRELRCIHCRRPAWK